MLRAAASAILATAAVLLLPAAAGAVIVPQQSIMGIELQMSKGQVKAAAGEPDEIRQRDHEIIGKVTEYRYGRTRVSIAQQSGVIAIRTRDRDERTADNVGVGTRKRALRRKLDGERCKREAGFHHCWLGRFRAGRTVTDFRLNKNNRVRSVTLAIVID
jgi:hypothetical protein